MVGATGSNQTAKARSTATALSFNASTNVLTASQLDLSANATANDSVLYLSGTPTSASGTNGLFGIGALNFSDTDIIANFTHNVNGYAQVVVQNKNSGASSSADIIVNNDRAAGTTYYGDFGINGTTFSAGGVFGDVDGTYLYAAGGTLTLGSLNDYAVKIATNNTERVRINATGVGIGTTNPQSQLHITGQFQSTQANSTTTGGGQIYLNGATGNRIDFNTNGVAAPAFTTRSAGTKLVLYPSISGSGVDFAFGIQSATLWSSVPEFVSAYQFRWYGGTTQLADLKGTGEFLLGSSTLTGTATQRLQVTGGAYVSGNLGVGVTNPASNTQVAIAGTFGISEVGGAGTRTLFTSSVSGFTLNHNDNSQITFQTLGTNRLTYSHSSNFWTIPAGIPFLVGTGTSTGTASQRLQVDGGAYVSGSVGIGTASPAFTADIAGDARVTSTNKMRFGGTAGTTNFYIQYNSTANSLDFVAG